MKLLVLLVALLVGCATPPVAPVAKAKKCPRCEFDPNDKAGGCKLAKDCIN